MMYVRKYLLPGKRKYLHGLFLLMYISLISVAFSMAGSNDCDIAGREVFAPPDQP